MSVKRRLQATIKHRSDGRVCWRCALIQSRHQSTIPRHFPPRSPIVTDAFIILAQENLNRLVEQDENFLARKSVLRLRHPREFGTPEQSDEAKPSARPGTEEELLMKKYAPLVKRRQPRRVARDNGPTIRYHKSNEQKGTPPRFFRPLDTAAKSSHESPHQPSISENHTVDDEDENIHKDLEAILETFRNLQATMSIAKSAPIDPARSDERAQGLRTSHSCRLASQYYRNAFHLRKGGSQRSYSTRTGISSIQRFVSTSASGTSEIAPDPLLVEENETSQAHDGGENIRQRLHVWQAHQDAEHHNAFDSGAMLSTLSATAQNTLTQSGEDDSYNIVSHEDDMEDDLCLDVDEEEGTLSVINAPRWFRQGDLVEFWAYGEPILTVFIKNYETGSALFYTERGSWLVRKSRTSLFSVSNFVDRSDVKEILAFAPLEETTEKIIDRLQPMSIHAPRGAGGQVLEKMRRFHMASNSLYRKRADRLNRAYELLAPEMHKEGRKRILLQDAAMKVMQLGDISALTSTMLWTVHRTLCKMQNVITDWHTHRVHPEFEFVPKQDLKQIDRVKDWMREFQEITVEQRITFGDANSGGGKDVTHTNPIASFVEKARTAILASRHTRPISSTGHIGPSSQKVETSTSNSAIYRVIPTENLTPQDKTIVHYIDAWAASRYLNRSTNYPALGPMILRAVGLYDNQKLDESTGFTFLQELGIVSPWQNRSVYMTRAGLPGHDVSHPITAARFEVRRQLSKIQLTDSMVDFRKNWENLPVYCIDSAETTERDDGISLEDIDGEIWIHVHVANPSAFISPGSALASYAAKLSQSVYLPEFKYPMLEPQLSEKHFSLGVNRPCITFSAKVDVEGEVLDREISHGVVKNVHYVTPQQVEKALCLDDGGEKISSTLLTVGGVLPETTGEAGNPSSCSDRPLTSADIETLQRLRAIGEATQRRRVRNGALIVGTDSTTKNVVSPQVFFGRGVIDKPRPFSDKIQRFDGDPIISLTIKNQGIFTMIGQLMILAGEVCAAWCQERNLPIPYRGIRLNPEPFLSCPDFKKRVIAPQLERQGFADELDKLKYLKALGMADCSASPLEHAALGLPVYTQATSPLRRYGDMLTHWQIEAALRHERETKASEKDSTDFSYLPFSHEEVEAACKQIVSRAGQIQAVNIKGRDHWFNQALFRAFYFQEGVLPETFQVKVLFQGNAISKRSKGPLLGWGKVVELQDRSPAAFNHGGCYVGDVWEVRLQDVSLYTAHVIMEPLKLVSRNTDTQHSNM